MRSYGQRATRRTDKKQHCQRDGKVREKRGELEVKTEAKKM